MGSLHVNIYVYVCALKGVIYIYDLKSGKCWVIYIYVVCVYFDKLIYIIYMYMF